MTEKQLKEIIKAKEQELKELKAQLKALESKEETSTLSYFELVKMSKDEMKSELESLQVRDIKKIAREGGVQLISNAKSKCIKDMIDIIDARNNKGKAFR
ncbi:MAG: hypothetical protein ACRDB9_00480 [Cetobacterium sp.]